jgi:signal transduction histidine kinase
LRIATGQTGERAFLRVSDTGIGIEQEDLRGIFTPFHSRKGEHAPPGSPQAMVKGVGLSLAIADSIVKGRGGRIEVESRPGEGSTFTVWLPCEAEKS